jgi:diacylglycerol kinase (ATP)
MTDVNEFKKVGFVYNPVANKGKAKKVMTKIAQPLIEQLFEGRLAGIYASEAMGGSYTRTKQLIEDGCDLIVSCGGDGTNNEVVNAIMDARKEDNITRCAMAVLPIGTGDDFARTIKMAHHKEVKKTKHRIAQNLHIIASGKALNIDIGYVQARNLKNDETVKHWFINECGFGISADIMNTINNRKRMIINKDFTFKYLALSRQFTYQNSNVHLTMRDADDNVIFEKIMVSQLVDVANGQYCGNGMKFNPDAKLDDGKFSVCVFGDAKPKDAFRVLPKLYTGEHVNDNMVNMHECVKLSATSDRDDVYAIADGEIIGRLPVEFLLHHKALTLVVPSDFL